MYEEVEEGNSFVFYVLFIRVILIHVVEINFSKN